MIVNNNIIGVVTYLSCARFLVILILVQWTWLCNCLCNYLKEEGSVVYCGFVVFPVLWFL